MTAAVQHLKRPKALIDPWEFREVQFAAAAKALARLNEDAPEEDREILMGWLDAIMQAAEFPEPEQLVHFPLAVRNHLLASPVLWPERRFGNWVVVQHPDAASRMESRRDNMLEGIRLRRRGHIASVDPTAAEGLQDALDDHVVELGGEVLRIDGYWWLPTLAAATFFKLRWNDATGGRLMVRACIDDQRCVLPA